MSISVAARGGLFLTFLSSGCQCGPSIVEPPPPDAAERYADAICAAYERCQCMGLGFESFEECRARSIETFDEIAELEGVQFREECFEQTLEYFQNTSCDGLSEDTVIPCISLVGTQTIGEPCDPTWIMEGLGGGLTEGQCQGSTFCADGACAPAPPPGAEDGQACHLSLGVSCSAPNSHCSVEGLCAPQAGEGQPCRSPGECGIGLYCAGVPVGSEVTGECRPRHEVGDSCDPRDTWPCGLLGHEGYCSPEGQCVEKPWPAVCEYAHPSPGWYIPADWIPLGQ